MAFSEKNFPVNVLAPDADRFNADPATDIVNLGEYNRATFIITVGVGATGTTVVTTEACDDTTPTTATAIAFRYRISTTFGVWGAWTAATTSGFTTTAGSSNAYIVEVTSSELPDGSPYVRLQTTEAVDSPVDAGIECILSEPLYGGVSMLNPLT